MRNVKMVSHPKNTTVHKLLDARSHKGCIVAGSNPALTTLLHNQFSFLPCLAYAGQVFKQRNGFNKRDFVY